MVRELATKGGLPMPRVYLIDEQAPNAFATGRNPQHAAVAATTGIVQLLSERELRGVMAHELAHVKHRDILISTISATMAGAIGMLANIAMMFGGRDSEGRPTNPIAGLLVAILAPIAASLIQMAISRAREFEADRGGAEMSGDPEALAAALQKIHRYAQGIPMEAVERHPETAQMMIMNPLSGGGLRGLFSTHPSTEERVERLLAMACGAEALGSAVAGLKLVWRRPICRGSSPNNAGPAMQSRLSAALLCALLGATGCNLSGGESADAVAARREADGKAVGGACRHAGRAIEDCYTLNRRADKAAVYAGWREMNDYMRENKLEPVAPSLNAETVAQADADGKRARADKSAEKPATRPQTALATRRPRSRATSPAPRTADRWAPKSRARATPDLLRALVRRPAAAGRRMQHSNRARRRFVARRAHAT